MNQENKLKPVLRLHVQKKEECCGSDHQHGSVNAAEPKHHKEHGHDHEHEHEHAHDHADACCAHGTQATDGVAITKSSPAPKGPSRGRYRIDKMDCPTEERLIRNRLEPMADESPAGIAEVAASATRVMGSSVVDYYA